MLYLVAWTRKGSSIAFEMTLICESSQSVLNVIGEYNDLFYVVVYISCKVLHRI